MSSESNVPAFTQVPRIHIALINRRTVYLFKIEHSKMIIPAQSLAQAQNPIVLQSEKSILYVDKINLQPTSGAIMVNIPEPDKYLRFEEAKFHFSRYQGVLRGYMSMVDR